MMKLQYFGHLMWRTDSLEKISWCWERLKAGGEGDNRGWGGWMASPTQWTWIWTNSRRWWRTGKPGILQSTGLQRHDWVTEQQLRNLQASPNNSHNFQVHSPSYLPLLEIIKIFWWWKLCSSTLLPHHPLSMHSLPTKLLIYSLHWELQNDKIHSPFLVISLI